MQMMARELHWVLIFTTKDDSCSFCGQGFLPAFCGLECDSSHIGMHRHHEHVQT